MDTATHSGSRDISNPAQRRRFSMVSSNTPATTSMSRPRLARISLAFSGEFSKGTIWNLISGHCSWMAGHSSIRAWAGVMGDVPMRTISVSPCMAFLARLTESLQYWMIYFASLYNDTPAFVSVRPRWVRSNSFTPSASSSRLICLMTAVGVINICSAALLKLPASAAVRKVSS